MFINHVTCHFMHYHIHVRLELGIGLKELGIGLRIDNARRTVLARVSGLVLISTIHSPFNAIAIASPSAALGNIVEQNSKLSIPLSLEVFNLLADAFCSCLRVQLRQCRLS